MTAQATIMLVWADETGTDVVDMIDSGGDLTYLVRLFMDGLPQRIKENAHDAILRGVIADQKGLIADLRVALQEAASREQATRIAYDALRNSAPVLPA